MEKISNIVIYEYDEGNSHFFQTRDGSLAEVEIVDEELILHGITVNEEIRGRGVGSTLLKLVEKYAISHGCKKVSGTISSNLVDGDPSDFYIKQSYSLADGRFTKFL